MGLESYNMAYRHDNKKDLDSVVSLLIKDFNAVSRLSDEPKFIIKSEKYLIDILKLDSSISIRFAVCGSLDVILKVFEIFRMASVRYGGVMFDQHTKMYIRDFTNEELEEVKRSYLERQGYFFDNIAFVQDMALSAESIYKFIRENDVKPRVR